MNRRRLAILRVTPEFLVEFSKSARHNALPADARCEGTYYDADAHVISVVVTSQSFAEAPEGEILPVLPPPIFERP